MAKGSSKPPCWDCNGTGSFVTWRIRNGKEVKLEVTCGSCGGTGEK